MLRPVHCPHPVLNIGGRALGHDIQSRLSFVLCGVLLVCFTAPLRAQAPEPTDEKEATEAAAPEESTRPKIGDVTTEEVKRFLDPTRMISKLDYDFSANFLPGGSELFRHRVRLWYALNESNAAWVRVPYRHFSFSDGRSPRGIGDATVGWGFILHENVRRRLTTVAGGVEVLLPTGDAAKGTGFDRYVVRASGALATNPTDKFPVNFVVRYLHSFDGSQSETPDRPVRTLQLELQTFHILPKGFFLAFLPTFFIDLHQDFNVLSLGLGVGRALTRKVAVQGGYVEHISGRGTFNRGFVVGVTWLWGENKEERQ